MILKLGHDGTPEIFYYICCLTVLTSVLSSILEDMCVAQIVDEASQK